MTGRQATPVRVNHDRSLATVTIGNGCKRNALGSDGWRQLAREFGVLSREVSLRAVLVHGFGDTFCAGSDMTEWAVAEPAAVDESFELMEAAFRAIEACPVPVIAEVRGAAAGAGCQLALACDLRVMANSARIGMPIARLGIMASPAFAARIARLAGAEMARDLLYTGRLLDAGQAVAARLASASVADAELADHTAGLLDRIAGQPPAAVRAAKRAVTAATGEIPVHRLGPSVSYPDFQRGVAKFLGRAATTR